MSPAPGSESTAQASAPATGATAVDAVDSPRAGAWERFWFGPGSGVRLGVFRIIVMVSAYDAVNRFQFSVFQHASESGTSLVQRSWNPVFLLEVLGVEPPGEKTAVAVFWILIASLVCGMLGLATRVATAVAAVLFTYWAAVHYSFGQPHHDCIVLTFALWALAFAPAGHAVSVDGLLRRRGRPSEGGAVDRVPGAAFPIRFTRVSAAIGYFFAGSTKLALGGLGWANGYTLQAIMLGYRSDWSATLAGSTRLCQLMQVGLLAIQLAFPLVLLPGKWGRYARWFFIPGAVSFHLIAMKTMNTGSFLTLWFVVVAAFVEWERVPAFLRRIAAQRPLWQRAALAAAIAAFLFACYRVFISSKPVQVQWTAAALAASLAAWAAVLVLVAKRGLSGCDPGGRS